MFTRESKPAPWIRSVVNVGSASGHTGSEFPEYAASKGGILSYTKNVANRLAPQGICNSVDPGGVLTELNGPVMDDAPCGSASCSSRRCAVGPNPTKLPSGSISLA
ncbi:SDR family NAD(P)-dependent oxidoreductase [uncultured Slackia sp.]|uniref:SDR family NAD(P)-dependent oxidoreductase n=1 Tax=uncultured Slackia sp. TaxID=665903 RepID=UPI0034A544EA